MGEQNELVEAIVKTDKPVAVLLFNPHYSCKNAVHCMNRSEAELDEVNVRLFVRCNVGNPDIRIPKFKDWNELKFLVLLRCQDYLKRYCCFRTISN